MIKSTEGLEFFMLTTGADVKAYTFGDVKSFKGSENLGIYISWKKMALFRSVKDAKNLDLMMMFKNKHPSF